MENLSGRPLVVCVAEKPSLAVSIANFMSDGTHVTRRGTLDVHEFVRKHDGRSCDFKVTSVTGHVLTIDFPHRFQSWDLDPGTLFDAPVVKKEASKGTGVVEHLEREARGASYLILWLDCDREGENICFEVIDACVPVMARDREKNASSKKVQRAKFSAVTKQSIENAMRSLGEPDVNQARAVDARQEIDLKIGVAFTRFQTNHFRGKFDGLDSKVVSFGPCQTPTLGFAVERQLEIARFVAEPFWGVEIRCELGDGDDDVDNVPSSQTRSELKKESKAAHRPSIHWRRARVFDKAIASMYRDLIAGTNGTNGVGTTNDSNAAAGTDHGTTRATVTDCTTTATKNPPPPGLNTVDLLKSASAGMNMGAHHAMQVAERLYIAGFISYPRTESSAFPDGFNFVESLTQCRKHPEIGESMVARMLGEAVTTGSNRTATTGTFTTTGPPRFRKPRGGVDHGDHPPITPTCCATCPDDVGGIDAWRLYDFVARRFVAACSSDLVTSVRKAVLDVRGEQFDVSGSETLEKGWTEAIPWRAPTDVPLREMRVGEVIHVQSVELTEGTTSPPGSLTESDLISKMEKHGIGTDASIPTHINNIEKRRYVTIESNPRRVLPTVLGQTLVNGYLAVDRDLVLPTTRQKLEQQLDLVARGEADHAAVVAHALSQFSKKFTHFVDNIHVLDELFELKFDQKSDSECDGVPFSKCGRCSRFLLLKKSSRGVPKLLCPTEDETYALPAGAVVTRFDGRTCPLCDFEVILCGFGGDISFPLCPRCFKSKPVPWPVNKQTGLSQKPPPFSCPHPVAHPIISQFVVCPCPECELAGELGAYLLTEPLPRGVKGKVRKTRKLHCARCELTLRLPKDVTECRPTRFKCASCFAFCVQVTYDTENTPLADGVTKHTACVSCDDLLQNESVLVKTPRRGTQQGSCGGRGRGRGDDGGGGGRGGHR